MQKSYDGWFEKHKCNPLCEAAALSWPPVLHSVYKDWIRDTFVVEAERDEDFTFEYFLKRLDDKVELRSDFASVPRFPGSEDLEVDSEIQASRDMTGKRQKRA